MPLELCSLNCDLELCNSVEVAKSFLEFNSKFLHRRTNNLLVKKIMEKSQPVCGYQYYWPLKEISELMALFFLLPHSRPYIWDTLENFLV